MDGNGLIVQENVINRNFYLLVNAVAFVYRCISWSHWQDCVWFGHLCKLSVIVEHFKPNIAYSTYKVLTVCRVRRPKIERKGGRDWDSSILATLLGVSCQREWDVKRRHSQWVDSSPSRNGTQTLQLWYVMPRPSPHVIFSLLCV